MRAHVFFLDFDDLHRVGRSAARRVTGNDDDRLSFVDTVAHRDVAGQRSFILPRVDRFRTDGGHTPVCR